MLNEKWDIWLLYASCIRELSQKKKKSCLHPQEAQSLVGGWRKKCVEKGRHACERQRPEHPGVWRREKLFPLIAMDELPEKGTFQMALKDMSSTWGLGRSRAAGQAEGERELSGRELWVWSIAGPWRCSVVICLICWMRQWPSPGPPPPLPRGTCNRAPTLFSTSLSLWNPFLLLNPHLWPQSGTIPCPDPTNLSVHSWS